VVDKMKIEQAPQFIVVKKEGEKLQVNRFSGFNGQS